MMATVSAISGNRAALGVGVGWMEDEYRAVNVAYKTRGRRCDEMIDVMRLLWQDKMVEYHGQHFDFPRSQLSPPPKGRIPIYVGGDSAPAIRRAVLQGDGWITSGLSRDTIPDNIGKIRKMLKDAGRENEPFEFIATIRPDLEFTKRLKDLGATSIFNLATPEEISGRVTAQQKLDSIRRYSDEIIAKI
jgi:alkanesulfonate monooxygenase SsuD/methylene tetrahydromethanopterin reductase-like flavin-dependent oxidoreductase (luciferase family)